jgi:hypothetical protein
LGKPENAQCVEIEVCGVGSYNGADGTFKATLGRKGNEAKQLVHEIE